ncbi:MAG: hypothetical protein ABF535_10765, partial [Acetobacter sp.]
YIIMKEDRMADENIQVRTILDNRLKNGYHRIYAAPPNGASISVYRIDNAITQTPALFAQHS